jgi:hypothetical protein
VSRWISHGSPIVIGWVRSCTRFKPHAQRENRRGPEIVKVSGFRSSGIQDFGGPDDERSGHSIVKVPK